MRVSGQPDETAVEAVAQPDGATAALLLGIERGLEPQAAFADDGATGVVTTRSSSWWNFRRCKTCGHTFRRGDHVTVNAWPARDGSSLGYATKVTRTAQ